MRRTRLDIRRLRSGRLPRPPAPQITLTSLAETPAAMNLSRRELLQVAGAAMVVLPPAGRSVSAALLGKFELTQAPGRCVFRLGGRERWVIDTRRFAGAPRLMCQRESGRIRIELRGARYPGTDLPADMVCELRRALVGWRMRLRMELGGFECEVPLERWLAGHEEAAAGVSLDALAWGSGSGPPVRLSGPAQASFEPSWTLRLAGPAVATALVGRTETPADSATIHLPDPASESLISQPSGRRTLLTLHRNGRKWSLEEAVGAPLGGRLTAKGQAFDRLVIEASESRTGALRRAMVAEAEDGVPRFGFAPGAGDAADLRAEQIPLCRPRYAVAFDESGDHEAFVADFDSVPVWIRGGGLSLQVGAGPAAAPFEFEALGGRRSAARCEPALLAMAAPLEGLFVEPAAPAADVRVEIVTEEQLAQRGPVVRMPVEREQPLVAQPPASQPPVTAPPVTAQPPAGRVVVGPEGLGAILALAPLTVTVVRPQDLLVLRFQFVNLALRTQIGQPPRLARVKEGDPAYIIVHFPPQAIGEEAFLEAAPEYSALPGAMADEGLKAPPIAAIMAGESRLAFRLPETVKELPYTMEALLDWGSYVPSLVPTALPPPAPLQTLRIPGRTGIAVLAPQVAGGYQLRTDAAALQGRAVVRSGATASGARPPIIAGGFALAESALQAETRLPRTVEEPSAIQTAIEAPYQLILSPNRHAGWVHAIQASTAGGRTELWHTRMGVRAEDGTIHDRQYQYALEEGRMRVVGVSAGDASAWYRTLRAVWSPGYKTPLEARQDPPRPFRMSLDKRDRYELVQLTSDFTISAGNPIARVVRANRLMLSALGAWLDTRYAAAVPIPGLSVEEWKHQATMGRDQYVKVVYKGYLFPFGHAASLVKVTERKFERAGGGSVAYLRQRYFIVVREPTKTYPARGQQKSGRKMPLRTVTITTPVTPTLRNPAESKVPGISASAQTCFWPRLAPQEDFVFGLVAEDWDGHRVSFSSPLIFVGTENLSGQPMVPENAVCLNEGAIAAIIADWASAANASRRTRPMYGQAVAFAESSPARPGDTTLEATSITFSAETSETGVSAQSLWDANQPRFYPTMVEAQVRIPSVVQMTGDGAGKIRLHQRYVDVGWHATQNAGQVFAEVQGAAPMAPPADKSGGLATPSLAITGLSKQFGPIGGDPTALAGGAFDPKDFFKNVAAKILGGIELADIIPASFSGGKNVPRLVSTPIYPGGDNLAPPEAVETVLVWKPDVKAFGPYKPRSGAKFELDATFRTELASGKSVYSINGLLTKFDMDMFGFIIVAFESLKFRAGSGEKTKVTPDITKVSFGGPLAFVNELKDFLNSGVLGNGLSIDITPTGVRASYVLAIPAVSTGILVLQNITLTAGLHIPFTGEPVRLRFAFCERENPFLLTVSMFGGGGFFGLALGLDGVEVIEAALEFGAAVAIDLGVASGGVEVMAGIYFKWEDNASGGAATLTGYLRMGGALSVLGIITLSLEFYLGLTYESAGNKVWGEASLTVKVEVLFFSTSVSMSVRREFADPDRITFKKLMPQKSVWDTYCAAFA